MLRLSPRRNQRTRGMKVKNVLQVSVLLGICIWFVLYQMPHPNNGESFSQHGIKLSQKLRSASDIKLGRKDLKPRTTTLVEIEGEKKNEGQNAKIDDDDKETEKKDVEKNKEDGDNKEKDNKDAEKKEKQDGDDKKTEKKDGDDKEKEKKKKKQDGDDKEFKKKKEKKDGDDKEGENTGKEAKDEDAEESKGKVAKSGKSKEKESKDSKEEESEEDESDMSSKKGPGKQRIKGTTGAESPSSTLGKFFP